MHRQHAGLTDSITARAADFCEIRFVCNELTLVRPEPSCAGSDLEAAVTRARHVASRVLMRWTIQLKRRPYKALDMASRTSAALSTVLVRMMVSPLVTTH
ncbi:hypothetical protein EYF80_035549 [Liparis tanakae]|uniref:Uncharacterized protein n=1 Tax=Liparis tanakae TaxID=230148 RepID=A0A4Z2GLP2_9TELE|nr:hypothetical protein EYF80_035549 [Liparis tanakae]